MYNIKKLFRKKSNFILIAIFTIILFSLIFLFKYIFIVQDDIEKKIYNNYHNREIIIYDNSNEMIEKLKNSNHILFVYNDFNTLEAYSNLIGKYKISPLLKEDMPDLLKGIYPKNSNEIILPSYTFFNNEKIDLKDYLNKEIIFELNNEIEINLIVTGISKVVDSPFVIYYNLININKLLDTNDNLRTGNLRAVIDDYQNLDKVTKEIKSEANLYNTSRLEEVQVYRSLFNLALLLTGLIIFFIVLILIIISSILYHETTEDRFIQFALGYDNNKIAINYINYFIQIIIISLMISILGYIISIISYNKYIYINNIVLNDLFKINSNNVFFLPIILLFILIFILLYLFIRIKLSNQKYTSEQ